MYNKEEQREKGNGCIMKTNEKGSISLFIIVAILLFIFSLLSIFVFQKNKNIANDDNINKIEEQYNKDLNNINEIYEEQLNQVEERKIGVR